MMLKVTEDLQTLILPNMQSNNSVKKMPLPHISKRKLSIAKGKQTSTSFENSQS